LLKLFKIKLFINGWNFPPNIQALTAGALAQWVRKKLSNKLRTGHYPLEGTVLTGSQGSGTAFKSCRGLGFL
jgi:hypothetical protein